MDLYSSYISLWGLSPYVCTAKELIFSANSKGIQGVFYSEIDVFAL